MKKIIFQKKSQILRFFFVAITQNKIKLILSVFSFACTVMLELSMTVLQKVAKGKQLQQQIL